MLTKERKQRILEEINKGQYCYRNEILTVNLPNTHRFEIEDKLAKMLNLKEGNHFEQVGW